MTDRKVPANGAQSAAGAEDDDAAPTDVLTVANVVTAAAVAGGASIRPEGPATTASPRLSRRRRRMRSAPNARQSQLMSETSRTAAPAETPATVTEESSELRAWIKDNATLLSNASLLISIAALALTLLPGEGLVEPYIQAFLFGAALLLLLELHHQWPDDLQLVRLRSVDFSDNHSWRMTWFAFLFQLATALFVVWAVLTTPIILFPLTAIAVVLAFRRFYFRRFGGRFARILGILSLVFVLLLSELLMLTTWAVISGERLTIQLWADERSDAEALFTLEVGN